VLVGLGAGFVFGVLLSCLFLCSLTTSVIYLITSAKEVMFLPDFVCLFVCLCVSKITQKVMDVFF